MGIFGICREILGQTPHKSGRPVRKIPFPETSLQVGPYPVGHHSLGCIFLVGFCILLPFGFLLPILDEKVRKLHHTTTIDNHKSTTENRADTCLRHLRFFEVLNADVTQNPKIHISDTERKLHHREWWPTGLQVYGHAGHVHGHVWRNVHTHAHVHLEHVLRIETCVRGRVQAHVHLELELVLRIELASVVDDMYDR